VGCADGDGGLDDDDLGILVRTQGLDDAGDVVGGGPDELHVGLTGRAGGRADADEDHGGAAVGFVGVRGEAEATGLDILLHEFCEARLVDGAYSLIEKVDLARVDIEADDIVPGGGKADAGDEADISGTNHC